MRAAIAAAEAGVDVLVLTKGKASRSGATPMACPSYQAALSLEDDRDSPELAFEDTCFEGRYLGDENLISVLTAEATERAMDLSRYGVKFRTDESGSLLQVLHPGQSFERNLVIQGSGYALAAGLYRELRRHGNIKVKEDCVAASLLHDGDSISGVSALNMCRGSVLTVYAGAVILATGGYPELWRWTDTEPGLTGDGLMLAYHAGAELVDLEMMLFYPAGLCFPNEIEGTLVQYEGLMTGNYCAGQMLNGLKEPFLPPTDRLPVRDVMMRLMFKEIEEGRETPHGGLYIDLTKSPKSKKEIKAILNKLDSLPYNQLEDFGIDVLHEPIEVMPVTHYTLGGVRINEWTETNVRGLFAAGEITGNIHGANRTSGNALAETQVFGARAGQRAAEYAKRQGNRQGGNECMTWDRITEAPLEALEHRLRPIELMRKVKTVMHNYVHYQRNAEGLTRAIEKLQRMRQEDLPLIDVGRGPKTFNYEMEEALEVAFMIDLAEMVAAAALEREESRGHHWRSDFPKMRPEWEKHTIVRRVDDKGYSITHAPVVRLKDRTQHRREIESALLDADVL